MNNQTIIFKDNLATFSKDYLVKFSRDGVDVPFLPNISDTVKIEKVHMTYEYKVVDRVLVIRENGSIDIEIMLERMQI